MTDSRALRLTADDEPRPSAVAVVFELRVIGTLLSAALASPLVPADAEERRGMERAREIVEGRRAHHDPDWSISGRLYAATVAYGRAFAPGVADPWLQALLAHARQAPPDGATDPRDCHSHANTDAVEELLLLHASASLNIADPYWSAPVRAGQVPPAMVLGLACTTMLVESRLNARDPRGDVRARVLARHARFKRSVLRESFCRQIWFDKIARLRQAS